jgi:hypothetical protein
MARRFIAVMARRPINVMALRLITAGHDEKRLAVRSAIHPHCHGRPCADHPR